ncbi:MAG TPA: hypothetical protein PK668_15730 [Myxococcota bacterium]|nr:hypothetical protein [Myxococcota bacterium]HRY94346.1 hypothetical protein [Myxococcota bacterium]HSA22101.1 hypothetical protein [Myxococcota bacterium]
MRRLTPALAWLLGLALLTPLLLWAYGFDPLGTPVAGWRDHPFTLGNLEHARAALDWQARLLAYDPMHLFGWTPQALYNPLSTLAGAAVVGAAGGGEGAYRLWLVLLLFGTALALAALLPRGLPAWCRAAGGLLAGGLSLLVYPLDVGILDANPVQVLYTGQWPQRLGVALGLCCLAAAWRTLELLGRSGQAATGQAGPRAALGPALATGALLGAALFAHAMSGAATALGLGLLVALRLAGPGGGPRWSALALLAVAPLSAALLWADPLHALLTVQASHHALPFLGWQLPEAAVECVREVAVPGLPLLILPLVGGFGALRAGGPGRRAALARGLLPLLVLVGLLLASPGSALAVALGLSAAALLTARLEGELALRHLLPALAAWLLCLAAGPDSLRFWGLELDALLPFGAGLGWAKLAAFARLLLVAWLGLLLAEGLAAAPAGRARGLVLALGLAGLLLPLGLSLESTGRTGAQTFFGWMRAADRQATGALTARLEQAARLVPEDGLGLAEDTLHHPEGSPLAGAGVPHGHLPYLAGPAAGRPLLGGEVTTRWLTHPLAQTGRGQLLCRPFDELERAGAGEVVARLRSLSIAEVVAHSPALVRALSAVPGVERLDAAAGLTRLRLGGHRPLVTDQAGQAIPGARLGWRPDGFSLELPDGARRARLRLVWNPALTCAPEAPGQTCAARPWREAPLALSGCQDAADAGAQANLAPLQVDVPWLELEVAGAGPARLEVRGRAPAWPLALMALAWLGALGVWVGPRLRARRRAGGA